MKKLIDATYLGNFQILLVYENENPRLCDFTEFLQQDLGDFKDLKEETIFKQFKILEGWNTLEWSNGYEIAPETLYEISQPTEFLKSS